MPLLRAISWMLLVLLVAIPAAASEKSNYIRLVTDAHGKPRALQVGISHFVLGSGQRVDLVGAVHIAEGEYYHTLKLRFRHYDRVLYELVVATQQGESAPTGPIQIPKDETHASGVSQVQLMLCHKLGLQYQLYAIDYSAPNFRHADFTAAEFQASMNKHGESAFSLFLKIFQTAMQSEDEDEADLDQINILDLMTREPTRHEQRILRRVLAHNFPEVERMTSEMQGTALIAGRNQRAMDVLARELRTGQHALAIFYGAGHMTDMERRLMKLPGARLQGREWLTAWNLEDIR